MNFKGFLKKKKKKRGDNSYHNNFIDNAFQSFLDINNEGVRAMVMVFNTTFNNISAISLQSVLLVEDTRVP